MADLRRKFENILNSDTPNPAPASMMRMSSNKAVHSDSRIDRSASVSMNKLIIISIIITIVIVVIFKSQECLNILGFSLVRKLPENNQNSVNEDESSYEVYVEEKEDSDPLFQEFS